MGIPYKTKKEAWDNCRIDEVTIIDKSTNRYYNIKKKKCKSLKSSGKLTADDLVPFKEKWGSK